MQEIDHEPSVDNAIIVQLASMEKTYRMVWMSNTEHI
jgi:hypothetical protein